VTPDGSSLAVAARPPSDPERVFRAMRAHLRQEFAAPAAAIVGYAEMLLEDCGRAGLDDLHPDLRRIHTAGLALERLIGSVLASESGPDDAQNFGQRLRHDLRTPINAIKGYGEMLLEDVEGSGAANLAQDLRRLLTAAEEMLERIDALVDFNHDVASVEARDPLRTGAHLVSRTLQSMGPDRRGPDRQSSVGTILVVDDNESNRDLLARRLSRDGHRVELAVDGAEALRAVGERAFDLVLLDLMMPDISGYEVLTRLKADERTREIPVIMISALNEMDSIVRCIEAGAVDYLPKPFEPTLLQARIGSSLDNKLLRDRERRILGELRQEKERNDALLLSILPEAIVERIKAGDGLIADDVAEATILFADIVGFTPLAGSLEASALVQLLNAIFSAFDRLSSHLLVVPRMAVSFGVERDDGLMDRAVEVIRAGEGLVSQVMPLQVAPDPFDVVQLRSVFRQPLDREPVSALGEGGTGGFAGVDRAVIQDEHDRLDRNPDLWPIAAIDFLQESDEVQTPLGPAGVNNEVATGPVKHPEHRHFRALAWRWNAQVGPFLGPDLRQIGMGEDFGLVPEQKHDVARLRLGFEQLSAQARTVHRVRILAAFQRVAGPSPTERPLWRSTTDSREEEMRTPERFSISSARRGSVQFGRSATGPDRTSSATAKAHSALTGAGPGATDFFSTSMPPVMKALRQNRTVSSRTPKASAICPLVQPERVSKIARARSASPRSRERLSAIRARLCSSVAATGDLPAMIPISCQIKRRNHGPHPLASLSTPA
jgi:CheY-like chemotaxis protein